MLHNSRNRNRRRAFTLLEVLMVIVIIGILVAFIAPQFGGVEAGAKRSLAEAAVESGLGNSLELYKMSMKTYPEELEMLMVEPEDEELARTWDGPYLKAMDNLKDPWDNDWYYQYPGEENEDGFDLGSNGPDGEWGTDDDITNWSDQRR